MYLLYYYHLFCRIAAKDSADNVEVKIEHGANSSDPSSSQKQKKMKERSTTQVHIYSITYKCFTIVNNK